MPRRGASEIVVVLVLIGVAFLVFVIASGSLLDFLEKLGRREDSPTIHSGVARIIGPTRQEVKLFIEVRGEDVTLVQANSSAVLITPSTQLSCTVVSIRPVTLKSGTVHEVLVEVSCGSVPYNSKLRVKVAWRRVGSSAIQFLDALVPLTI